MFVAIILVQIYKKIRMVYHQQTEIILTLQLKFLTIIYII